PPPAEEPPPVNGHSPAADPSGGHPAMANGRPADSPRPDRPASHRRPESPDAGPPLAVPPAPPLRRRGRHAAPEPADRPEPPPARAAGPAGDGEPAAQRVPRPAGVDRAPGGRRRHDTDPVPPRGPVPATGPAAGPPSGPALGAAGRPVGAPGGAGRPDRGIQP